MTDKRQLSPIQFEERDGQMRVVGGDALELLMVEGHADTATDWTHALNMPTYREEWEELARVQSDKRRGRVKFILLDHSPLRLPGAPRVDLKNLLLPTTVPLELDHRGLLIGEVDHYSLISETERGALNVEGDCIIAEGWLFDSDLVSKLWDRRDLFTHACPNLWRPPNASGYILIQVTLTMGDFAGCPNARVLEWSA